MNARFAGWSRIESSRWWNVWRHVDGFLLTAYKARQSAQRWELQHTEQAESLFAPDLRTLIVLWCEERMEGRWQ